MVKGGVLKSKVNNLDLQTQTFFEIIAADSDKIYEHPHPRRRFLDIRKI